MKPKKCKICGEPFVPQRPIQMACSYKCGAEYGRKQVIKNNVKATLKRNKEWKQEKANLKTYTQRVNEVKVLAQKFARLRDEKDGCISCGSLIARIYHGGHYKKAEIYSGVIFHEHNINKQCLQCNFFKDGNEANYRQGLVKKIGESSVKELEELADKTRQHEYTREELEQIKQYFKTKIKQLNA